MARHLRAALRALSCAAWTLLLLPVQMVAFRCGWRLARTIPALYHRGNCAIMGIALEPRGRQSRVRPTLFVSNHSSYLDIIVLAALLDARFIAKREIADWPVFGLLARLNGSVFVERRPSQSGRDRSDMLERLAAGESLILFPEGTSSDGNRVLPFNSTFFSLAETRVEGRPIVVQPISLAYTALNRLPMGRRNRPYFAWYGDMGLLGHMWAAIGLGQVTATVEFHEPVTIEQFASRKELAAYCHEEVAKGLSRLLSGRAEPLATAPRARLAQP